MEKDESARININMKDETTVKPLSDVQTNRMAEVSNKHPVEKSKFNVTENKKKESHSKSGTVYNSDMDS